MRPTDDAAAGAREPPAGVRRRASGWIARHPQLASWVLTTIAVAIYLLVTTPRVQVGDAHQYLQLSATIRPPSLAGFSDRLRGYGFPLVLAYARSVADVFGIGADGALRLVSLVTFPILTCVVAPAIARGVSTTAKVTVPRLLVLSALVFTYWRLDLLYALSDLPSLALFGAGLALLLREELSGVVLGGFCLGFAVSCRPAYLVPMLAAIGLGVLLARGVRRNLVRTGLAALGVVVAFVPQVAIGSDNYGSLSPFPPSSGTELTRLQLTNGLRFERYDTFVQGAVAPTGSPISPAALTSLTSLAVTNEPNQVDLGEAGHGFGGPNGNLSLSEYLAFVAHRPVSTPALYARHVLNGLDTKFGGTYVENRSGDPVVVRLVNFALLSTAIILLARRFWSRWRHHDVRWRGPATWFVALVALVTVQAAITAVENRFLLPVQMTLFGVLALSADRRDWPDAWGARAAVVAGPIVAAGLWLWVAAPIPAVS